jgi:2TM domain-containing protein
VAIYLVVNLLLVVIWALSGVGQFWPIWAMLGWGIGLAFHGWSVYVRKPISEDEIRREMQRGP